MSPDDYFDPDDPYAGLTEDPYADRDYEDELAARRAHHHQRRREEPARVASDDYEQWADTWRHRLLDGKAWLTRTDPHIEPVWGNRDTGEVLAARLQPTILVAHPGAGKTTLAQHITLGRIGVPGFETVLGFPVAPLPEEAGKALYLASDRPEQARLAMARLVKTKKAFEIVERRLVVWEGPPPVALNRRPKLLLEMAQEAGAGFVVPDSLKDMAMKLSDDEVGSTLNSAHQALVADGRDVLTPHHPRKRTTTDAQGENRPTIDDMYGSAWIGNGAGSVLFLIKEPTSIELVQVKAPLGDGISLRYRHDTRTGTLSAGADDDVLAAVRDAGPEGLTTPRVAKWVHTGREVSNGEIEAVRRRLRQLKELGLVFERGPANGKKTEGTKWIAT